MKKFSTKLIALLIALVLVIGCLAACSSGGSTGATSAGTTSNEPEPAEAGPALVGKWAYKTMKDYCYVFNEDGTGIYSTDGGETGFFEFEWTDNGDSVTLQYTEVDTPATFKYTIKGNTLSIEDSFGDFIEYVKE